MAGDPSPLENVPPLLHHTTLHSPSTNVRAWSSQAHPDAASPLLATAASDKSVHIWDMRGWKLLSTIAGGHKRSVRCVGWKDYGRRKRRKSEGGRVGGGNMGHEENADQKKDPVILATGSFDANCGLWMWNPDQGGSLTRGQSQARTVPGSFDDEDMTEKDFTHDNDNQAEEENEDWHFSMLLTGPDSEIKDLAFSPPHYGSNLLATCSRDKSVWVWEEVEDEEWETVAVLSEHTGDVKCVTWLAGARTTKGELRRRLKRRSRENKVQNGGSDVDQKENNEEDEEEIILGSRELLASGSYDDTIRLHHDDESEGDWITIAVLTGHEGTVWDLKFEPSLNLVSYPLGTIDEEVIVDWEPRLISCSDDLSVRVWKKQLNEKEQSERKLRIAEARQGKSTTADEGVRGAPIQTGFMSNRLPSVIRPNTSTEKWAEEASLPKVHVRSVYAVDWSARTGLIVSCGGDGLIAVYQEVALKPAGGEDVLMNGTAEHEHDHEEGDIKKLRTEWKVVATMEAAHDEYEINHVCWAPVRDQRRQLDAGEVVDGSVRYNEEYIVTTGDDGEVRVWQLPKEVLDQVRLGV